MNKINIGNIAHAFLLILSIIFPSIGMADDVLLGELENAFKNRDVASAQKILGGSIDISVEMNGWPMIVVAANHGRVDIVRAIIATGANLDASNDRGDTATIIAAYNNNLELVELLARSGANLDIRGNDGATALIWAVRKKHIEVVRTLLRYGANTNVFIKPHGFSSSGSFPGTDGATALIVAAEKGSAEIVELLLDAGADIDATDPRCCSALCASLQNQRDSVRALLEKRGASKSPACLGRALSGYIAIGFAAVLLALIIWDVNQGRSGLSWRITGYLVNAALLALIGLIVMPVIFYQPLHESFPTLIVVAVAVMNIAALMLSRNQSIAKYFVVQNRVLNYVVIVVVLIQVAEDIERNNPMVALTVVVGLIFFFFVRLNIRAFQAQFREPASESVSETTKGAGSNEV
jgi:ankyrin repeat protein